jgi:hypothetical protein
MKKSSLKEIEINKIPMSAILSVLPTALPLNMPPVALEEPIAISLSSTLQSESGSSVVFTFIGAATSMLVFRFPMALPVSDSVASLVFDVAVLPLFDVAALPLFDVAALPLLDVAVLPLFDVVVLPLFDVVVVSSFNVALLSMFSVGGMPIFVLRAAFATSFASCSR